MKTVRIGNYEIGGYNPAFIIAEIGINHNGDIKIAKQLIDTAKSAGCNAVKFQKRTIDVVYTREELEKPRDNPFGPTNGHLKRGLEFGKAEYSEIDEYCKQKGILWSASPWDEESVEFLISFDIPFYKVASATLTDDGVLEKIRDTGKPAILAAGMSTAEEVDHAVSLLKRDRLILMHATSNYPPKPEHIHLRAMKTLMEKYPDIPVGYSGHEEGILPSIIAVGMGASVVERHLTLSNDMWGSDHKASIEPEKLREMTDKIREVEIMLGDPAIQCLPEELPIKQKLRRKG